MHGECAVAARLSAGRTELYDTDDFKRGLTLNNGCSAEKDKGYSRKIQNVGVSLKFFRRELQTRTKREPIKIRTRTKSDEACTHLLFFLCYLITCSPCFENVTLENAGEENSPACQGFDAWSEE